MPAQVYSHIYNQGVEKRAIFADGQDYETFLGYLKDYLSPPGDPESVKKAFTVNGRVFRGTPHQPKNYFEQIELVAYLLMPDHFHLLIHPKTSGSLERFIRSLATRYSMYFNKKYTRSGALFTGPYKSADIKDVSTLLHLTLYWHQINDYSSYPEFTGARETPWVKPQAVLSLVKGAQGYKNLVEKYQFDPREKELLKGVLLESDLEHLERRDFELAGSQTPENQGLGSPSKMPGLVAAAAVFGLLLTLGIRNITTSTAKIQAPAPSLAPIESGPTPLVSGVENEVGQEEQQKEADKIMLVVKITDGAGSINIREAPTTKAAKIASAEDGATFEFVAIDSGWYEVKLTEGSSGFISAKYIEILENANN